MAQSHTPHDCCVRFATDVADGPATLASRRALPLPAPIFHRLDHASFAWRTFEPFQSLGCTRKGVSGFAPCSPRPSKKIHAAAVLFKPNLSHHPSPCRPSAHPLARLRFLTGTIIWASFRFIRGENRIKLCPYPPARVFAQVPLRGVKPRPDDIPGKSRRARAKNASVRLTRAPSSMREGKYLETFVGNHARPS